MTGACIRASPSTGQTRQAPGLAPGCPAAKPMQMASPGMDCRHAGHIVRGLSAGTLHKTATTAKEKFNKLQHVSVAGALDRQ